MAGIACTALTTRWRLACNSLLNFFALSLDPRVAAWPKLKWLGGPLKLQGYVSQATEWAQKRKFKRTERLRTDKDIASRPSKRVRYAFEDGISDDEMNAQMRLLQDQVDEGSASDVGAREGVTETLAADIKKQASAYVLEIMREAKEGCAFDGDFCPLEWWRKHEVAGSFPLVCLAAKAFLCVLASSVPVERVFSAAGRLVDSKRTELSDAVIHRKLFVHYNFWAIEASTSV